MEWKKRLSEEYVELSQRIKKLKRFLESEEFEKLDKFNQKLLVKQVNAMRDYKNILTTRIDLNG
jgi:thymidylate synthase ThyX